MTQGSTIAMNGLVINLQKLLELLFVFFAYLLQHVLGDGTDMRGKQCSLVFKLLLLDLQDPDSTRAHCVTLALGSLSQEARRKRIGGGCAPADRAATTRKPKATTIGQLSKFRRSHTILSIVLYAPPGETMLHIQF